MGKVDVLGIRSSARLAGYVLGGGSGRRAPQEIARQGKERLEINLSAQYDQKHKNFLTRPDIWERGFEELVEKPGRDLNAG